MTTMVTCPGDLIISVNSRKFSPFMSVWRIRHLYYVQHSRPGKLTPGSPEPSALCGQASGSGQLLLRSPCSVFRSPPTVTLCAVYRGRASHVTHVALAGGGVAGVSPFASASGFPGAMTNTLGFICVCSWGGWPRKACWLISVTMETRKLGIGK